jgi:hypothetical protein
MYTRALTLFALTAVAMSLHAAPGAQFSMMLPPQQDAHLADLAVEAAARGPLAPIPLMAGTRMMGAVYDRYRLAVLIANARRAAGEAADAAAIAAHPMWQARGTVIVAYAIDCDGRPNRPTGIRAQSTMGPVAPVAIAPPVRGSDAASLLPGLGLPADALVVAYRNLTLTNDQVTLDYESPACRGAAREMTFTLAAVPPRELFTSFAGVKLPAELSALPSPSTVRLQALVDATGRVRFPQQVQGPVALGPAAIATVSERTFAPFRVNGEGLPVWTLVTLVYTAAGAPAPAEPFTPPGMPGMTTTSRTTTVAVPRPAPAITRPPVAPAPPGQTDTQLARLAIEVAERGDPTPIPLDATGAPVHGVLFDRFLIGAVRARAQIAAGARPDPSPALLRNDAVLVAFPLRCGDRTVTPTDVTIVAGGNAPGPVRRTGGPLAGTELATRLPGVRLPDDASAWTFASVVFSTSLEVRIAYAADTCAGGARHVALPLQWVRGVARPRQTTVRMPDAAALPSPTTVRLRGVTDLEGRYRFPTIAEGPDALGPAAATHASQWRFQPYRVNGHPVTQVVLTTLTFTASGMPEQPRPPTPPPPPPPPSGAAPPIVSSATVGGRSTTEITSANVPGLSAATSRCAIAEDEAYGYTAKAPIAVGGSFTDGPGRSRRYLLALRGPDGQGLRIVRRGATMGPDGKSILDVYEATYDGLAQPVRLFVDLYQESPLRAPRGLVCATALDGK